jgi:tRNA1(Val) A37 N6-methylase TrmN6
MNIYTFRQTSHDIQQTSRPTTKSRYNDITSNPPLNTRYYQNLLGQVQLILHFELDET